MKLNVYGCFPKVKKQFHNLIGWIFFSDADLTVVLKGVSILIV